MYTPIKPKAKLLNGSFSPFMSPAISKVSTACDLLIEQRNSNSRKRFARKRQASNESMKRIKAYEIQLKGCNNEHPFGSQNVSDSSGKCEKVVLQLNLKQNTIMTSKYLKISTDRSSNNENFPSNYDFFHNGPATTRDRARKAQQFTKEANMSDYKMDLQLKSSEIMILEDENIRMRKDLEQKQSQIQRLQRQNQQLQQQIQSIKSIQSQRIHQLQIKLKQKDQQLATKSQTIQRNDKTLATLTDNLKQSQQQIQLLKIHLQQVIARKLSKQSLQLVSYRQVSLNNQLVQLRNDFEELKTQQHRNIQVQLNKISQKLTFVSKDCQNLSIANRILNKKNKQLEVSIQKKYKSQLADIKGKVRNLVKETAILKKENVTLRKNIHLQEKKTGANNSNSKQLLNKRTNRLVTGFKRSEQTLKQLDSDDSFTISLSK